MRDAKDEGKEQVDAGLNLLVRSHLVSWDRDLKRLKTVDEEAFEFVSTELHSRYGRMIHWMLFSAGAEFLAKGACLARCIEVREVKKVPDDPIEPLTTWRDNFLSNSHAKVCVTNFGTLRDLTKDQGRLDRLCDAMSATRDQRRVLISGYKFLQNSVRNRDAHAYIPKVRGRQFPLVDKLFIESFNLLLCWLPEPPADPIR
jgi:hypothetical protein